MSPKERGLWARLLHQWGHRSLVYTLQYSLVNVHLISFPAATVPVDDPLSSCSYPPPFTVDLEQHAPPTREYGHTLNKLTA